MPLTPKNRKEEWLQGLVDHETTLTPKNRPEEWMKEIIDASGGGGGGGVGVLEVSIDMQTMALDKTWNEINSAPFAVLKIETGGRFEWYTIVSMLSDEGNYLLSFAMPAAPDITFLEFSTDSADGYPVLDMG